MRLLSLVLVGAASLNSVSAQQPSPGYLPEHGERLVFTLPKNFEKAYHSDRIGSLTEYVPHGENVEAWTEMITAQIFLGLKVDPAPFLQTVGGGFGKSCPGFSSPQRIITGQANGYVVSMLVVKCPLNPATGKPETTLFRVIKGKDALYSVQHAWRSVATDKEVGDAVFAMRSVTVCDTRDASHPCPAPDQPAPSVQPEPKP